jgi:hypothetical protein
MKNILSSLTSDEKNRILEMHKSALSRQYLNEGFKAPNGITYKLDFKDGESFSQFVSNPSVAVENLYAKKLGFHAGDNQSTILFVSNIWQALAFTGRNPLKFSWGNPKMVQSLLSEASAGLKSLTGFIDAQQFITDDKLKIWNQPADPKNTQYTIWYWFYNTYIKPDTQTRAALITTPATPTKA